MTATYQQQQQQQHQAQYQQHLLQQQQEQVLQHQHALSYQQPSYTSVVQHGTAAWQKAAAQHGAGTSETTSSYHQRANESYTKQQYSQQQQLQRQQQQQQQQQQQSQVHPDSFAHSQSLSKSIGGLGSNTVALEMKKPSKSRFSALPGASTTTTSAAFSQKSLALDGGGKAPSSDSLMPANWPTSLKMFVARSFSGCKTDEDRKNISQALEKLINKVAFDGRVTTHKWELEDISASLIPKVTIPAQVQVQVPTSFEVRQKVAAQSTLRPNHSLNFEIKDSDLKPKVKGVQKASYRPSIDTQDNTYGPGAYGANSPVGSVSQINYGGNGNGNGNGKIKSVYSPVFNQSVAENDKKRKSRWELDSNSSNGDSVIAIYPKNNKQSKKEIKHKSQKILSNDRPDSNTTYSAKKKESGSRIIEKPPTNAEQAMREKRASRFKENENENEENNDTYKMTSLLSQSQIQFASKNKAKKRGNNLNNNNHHNNDDKHNKNSTSSSSDFDFESLIVIGTCQKLEKDYFRLTSAPIPNTVRPENILKQSLELLKDKWNRGSVEYIYMCSQFKSMRQDLTVQHIQNGKLRFIIVYFSLFVTQIRCYFILFHCILFY